MEDAVKVSTLGDRLRSAREARGLTMDQLSAAARYDGSLADADIRPNPDLWVLEMAIRHPARQFGALNEDLLLEDHSFAS